MRYRLIIAREYGGDGFTPRQRETREYVAELDAEPEYNQPFRRPVCPGERPWFIQRWERIGQPS